MEEQGSVLQQYRTLVGLSEVEQRGNSRLITLPEADLAVPSTHCEVVVLVQPTSKP